MDSRTRGHCTEECPWGTRGQPGLPSESCKDQGLSDPAIGLYPLGQQHPEAGDVTWDGLE